jgi:hypothetical protein
MREGEREKEKETHEYVVSYWVTFTVSATEDEDPVELAEKDLLEAIKDGTLADYLSDTAEVHSV